MIQIQRQTYEIITSLALKTLQTYEIASPLARVCCQLSSFLSTEKLTNALRAELCTLSYIKSGKEGTHHNRGEYWFRQALLLI
jgi:hypothetical protein